MPISYPSLPIPIILSILPVLPLTSALLSCANVSCPPHPTSPITASQCNLSDSSYVAIGLTSLTLPFLSPPRDITWTMASQLHNTGNTSYLRADSLVVQKDFWVGSPEDVDLGSWGENGEMSSGMKPQGCAVFLWDNAVERLSLSTQGEDDREKSCVATVGENCERDLIAQANGLLVNDGMRAEGSLAEKCGAVEAGLFRGMVPDSCKKVSAGDTWKSVKAVPLPGASGPQKIGSSMISNASTDCWPTLPKSNDLSFVWGYNDTSDVDSRKVNLVLSMFWTPNSNSSGQGQMSSEPNTQLTCLWPVALTEASVGSMQPSTAEHMMWSNRLLVAVAVILCVGLML